MHNRLTVRKVFYHYAIVNLTLLLVLLILVGCTKEEKSPNVRSEELIFPEPVIDRIDAMRRMPQTGFPAIGRYEAIDIVTPGIVTISVFGTYSLSFMLGDFIIYYNMQFGEWRFLELDARKGVAMPSLTGIDEYREVLYLSQNKIEWQIIEMKSEVYTMVNNLHFEPNTINNQQELYEIYLSTDLSQFFVDFTSLSIVHKQLYDNHTAEENMSLSNVFRNLEGQIQLTLCYNLDVDKLYVLIVYKDIESVKLAVVDVHKKACFTYAVNIDSPFEYIRAPLLIGEDQENWYTTPMRQGDPCIRIEKAGYKSAVYIPAM